MNKLGTHEFETVNKIMKQSKNQSLLEPKKQPESWAKGIIIKGKRVYHPYTLKGFDPNKL